MYRRVLNENYGCIMFLQNANVLYFGVWRLLTQVSQWEGQIYKTRRIDVLVLSARGKCPGFCIRLSLSLIFWYMMVVLALLNCMSSSLFSLRILRVQPLLFSLFVLCVIWIFSFKKKIVWASRAVLLTFKTPLANNIPLCSKSQLLLELYKSKHIRGPI